MAGAAAALVARAAGYLAALLADFDRALTPREIVQSFYKNPAFSLVTSTDEIRRVLYELITGDCELVDADGNRLAVASPAQISINSINQTLRRRPEQPTTSPGPRTMLQLRRSRRDRPSTSDTRSSSRTAASRVRPLVTRRGSCSGS